MDTNVLVSAVGWSGKPKILFKRILDGEFELIISRKQIEELQRVMEYPKLNLSEWQKSRFVSIILEIATVVETYGKLSVIKEDPDDNTILESAIENKADFIISGDEHLLKLREFRNVKLVSVSEFLDTFS